MKNCSCYARFEWLFSIILLKSPKPFKTTPTLSMKQSNGSNYSRKYTNHTIRELVFTPKVCICCKIKPALFVTSSIKFEDYFNTKLKFQPKFSFELLESKKLFRDDYVLLILKQAFQRNRLKEKRLYNSKLACTFAENPGNREVGPCCSANMKQ